MLLDAHDQGEEDPHGMVSNYADWDACQCQASAWNQNCETTLEGYGQCSLLVSLLTDVKKTTTKEICYLCFSIPTSRSGLYQTYANHSGPRTLLLLWRQPWQQHFFLWVLFLFLLGPGSSIFCVCKSPLRSITGRVRTLFITVLRSSS
jgi:hypothetical protein